jgi:UDP-N-acetylmuramoyl-L-alanyl-D-glutamate--2,6-diaminopimelate ligase
MAPSRSPTRGADDARDDAPRCSSIPTRGQFWANCRHRHPSDRLRVIGVNGTSGDHNDRPGGGRPADGELLAGLIGTVGVRIDGRDQPSALTTPEAPDYRRALAVMVEQRHTVVMELPATR